MSNRTPLGIESAVLDYSGFLLTEACTEPMMTDQEIRDYFSLPSFTQMFGAEDGDISDWPWSFEDLAQEAIRLRDTRMAAV